MSRAVREDLASAVLFDLDLSIDHVRVPNSEIYRAALLMVRHHGLNALARAVVRAEEMRRQGDHDEHRVWIRMVAAILALQDADRPADAVLH